MKVMVMVKASNDSEAGQMPSEKMLTKMGEFNQKLVDAGILVSADGLHPSSKGARIQFSGSTRAVTDGPFTETKELLAGYWIWRVKSMDEAIAWVKQCPNPHEEDCEIEIRQVFDTEDFGDAYTPEIREKNAAIHAQSLGLGAPRFENGRDLLIAGLNASYTLKTRSGIPAQWQRFAPSFGKVPGQRGLNSYGVCWNNKPDYTFDYLTGVEVSDASGSTPGFAQVHLPAQRYIVFTHEKPISEIGDALSTIWTKWLPDSGLKSAPAPCFERYTEDFNPKTGLGGAEIWVPIQP